MSTLLRYPVPSTVPQHWQRPASLIIGGLRPDPAVNLDASAGAATAAGGTAAVAFTWTADTGAATASGGVTELAGAFIVSAGDATADGGTVTLEITVAAAAGTASADGGDATFSIPVPPRATITGPGLTPGVVSAVSYPPPATRFERVSHLVAGLTPASDLNLDASGGTATADGGDATASAPIIGFPPAAIVQGGTRGVIRAPKRTEPPQAPPLRSRVLAAVEAPLEPHAIASGGTAALTITLPAAAGTATAGGGTSALTVTIVAQTGTSAAGGGSATASGGQDLTAQDGTATAGGGTLTAAFIYTATTGQGTAAGGNVFAAIGTPPVTHPSLGGTYSQVGTGGTINASAGGGTVTVYTRGGTVQLKLRGGTPIVKRRGGTVTTPSHGGVYATAGSGGEVL